MPAVQAFSTYYNRKVKVSMKKKLIARMVTLALILIAAAHFIPYAAGLGVMQIYSSIHEKQGLPERQGLTIKIPGGLATVEKDWYPRVLTYHAGKDFGRWAGEPGMELTVLYNFPAFRRIFDPQSPYYSSFYGAYVVYGADGERTMEELASMAAEYDYKELVLADLGLAEEDMVFDWKITGQEPDAEYAGIRGWTRTDAVVTTNGMAHRPDKFRRAYIQYGLPNYDVDESRQFQQVQLLGRVYGRAFEEYRCHIFFYILAKDERVMEQCDREILGRSSVYKCKE